MTSAAQFWAAKPNRIPNEPTPNSLKTRRIIASNMELGRGDYRIDMVRKQTVWSE
jgi:hypothetical protein